jgi:toluene monooxygenase system ferredoxin subunit
MSFVFALSEDELWVGEMRGIRLEDRRVLLLRTADGIRAYEDRCAHLGIPLSSGRLEGTVLTCSGHHYQYDAGTGRGINPKTVRLRAFDVRVEAGEILVDLASSTTGGGVG